MNLSTLNIDLKLQLARYLHNNYLLQYLALFYIDSSYNDANLYILRINREVIDYIPRQVSGMTYSSLLNGAAAMNRIKIIDMITKYQHTFSGLQVRTIISLALSAIRTNNLKLFIYLINKPEAAQLLSQYMLQIIKYAIKHAKVSTFKYIFDYFTSQHEISNNVYFELLEYAVVEDKFKILKFLLENHLDYINGFNKQECKQLYRLATGTANKSIINLTRSCTAYD